MPLDAYTRDEEPTSAPKKRRNKMKYMGVEVPADTFAGGGRDDLGGTTPPGSFDRPPQSAAPVQPLAGGLDRVAPPGGPARSPFQIPPYGSPAPAQAAPPPSDAIDPGALQEYRRTLLGQIDGLVKQRVLVGSQGDRAQAQAIALRENELRDQLHRANRVLAGNQPGRTPEQEAEAAASLQKSWQMSKGAMGQQAEMDMQNAKRAQAAAFFLTPSRRPENAAKTTMMPGPSRTNIYGQSPEIERAILDQPREGEVRPEIRARLEENALREQQAALAEQGRVAALPDTFTMPAREARPTRDLTYDRQRVGEEINAATARRTAAAAVEGLDAKVEKAALEAAIAKSGAEKAGYERVARGQDVGTLNEQGALAEARRTGAGRIANTSQDAIRNTAVTKLAAIAPDAADNIQEGQLAPRIEDFRANVIRPIQSLAAAGDQAGAAQLAAELIPALQQHASPQVLDPLRKWLGPISNRNAYLAAINGLINELRALATPVSTTPPAGFDRQ